MYVNDIFWQNSVFFTHENTYSYAVATLYAKEKGDSQNFDDKAGNYLVHDYPAKVALTAIVEEMKFLPRLPIELITFFQKLLVNSMYI